MVQVLIFPLLNKEECPFPLLNPLFHHNHLTEKAQNYLRKSHLLSTHWVVKYQQQSRNMMTQQQSNWEIPAPTMILTNVALYLTRVISQLFMRFVLSCLYLFILFADIIWNYWGNIGVKHFSIVGSELIIFILSLPSFSISRFEVFYHLVLANSTKNIGITEL